MTSFKIGLLTGFLCLIVTSISAQFTTGSRFVGGGFSLGTPVAPELASSLSVSLQPEFGHFNSPQVASGATVSFSLSSAKGSNSTPSVNTYGVGITPFAQRFIPLLPRFGFVLTGRSELLFSYKNTKTAGNTINSAEAITTDISLNLIGSPGLFYQLNQRWLLMLDLGGYQAFAADYENKKTTNYENNKATIVNEVKTSTFAYTIGRTFSLGGSALRIRYFLR